MFNFLKKKYKKPIINKRTPNDPEELKDIRLQTMEMSPLETWRYRDFWDRHRKCRAEAGKETFSGFPVGSVITSFEGTGLGWIITCKCSICGKEEDITDIDNW